MKVITNLTLFVCLHAAISFAAIAPENPNAGEELERAADVSGHHGGHLTIGERAEPKTLNPVMATDAVSREVIAADDGRSRRNQSRFATNSAGTRKILEDVPGRPDFYFAIEKRHPLFRWASLRC